MICITYIVQFVAEVRLYGKPRHRDEQKKAIALEKIRQWLETSVQDKRL